MPSISSHAAKRRARIARYERLADALDSRFRIPGLGLRVGWDSILGLVPGVGDVVTAGPGAAMILEGVRLGARKRALVRMGMNTGIDMTLGSVPVLGDVFDAYFKAHRKNVGILKAELARIERAEEEELTQWQNGTDPRMEAATVTRFSERRDRSRRKGGRAERSNETSPAKTS
ncbi:MAG: DUF4112 domain-containing protein [Paracoccaceae bacterium]